MILKWTLAIMMAALVLAGSVSAASSPGMPPSVVYGGEEAGQYVNGYLDGESYEDGASYDAYNKASCKTAHGIRYFKSWLGFKVWKFHEDVRFCYNGTKITSANRTSWAEFMNGAGYYWDYQGTVGSSCATNNCSDQAGGGSGYFFSQGKFRACWIAGITACTEKLPWVAIYANSMGGWSFNSGGS